MEVLQSAKKQALRLGLVLEPMGGGRISHLPAAVGSTDDGSSEGDGALGLGAEPADVAAASPSVEWRCQIYGFSSAFGPAPHEVTAALIRRWHPFAAVETSYEGY